MITLAQEYYDTLKDIQNNTLIEAVRIPSDEPFIEVDLNTRQLVLPLEFQDFLSVEKDHRAETIYFRVDRYFDTVDLNSTTIVIEYINAAGEGRIYPVMMKDITSEENKILFGWCLGAEATKLAGEIQFAVRFYLVAQDEPVFTYSLNTIAQTGVILHGMDNINDDEEYDYPASVITEIYGQIENLKNKQLMWIDLP